MDVGRLMKRRSIRDGLLGAGLLLTAVRARTGSIALPLLAHALINLTGSGAVSAAPRAAAYLAASALCTLCALPLLRDAA